MFKEYRGQRITMDGCEYGRNKWKIEMKLGTENYVIVLGCPALRTSPCLHRLLFRADNPPACQPLSIMREVHLTLSPCIDWA